MMTVMIVDDEKWMRKTVRNSINWNQYDMEILFEAEDGIQAYEKMMQLKPDLVIADIEMPGMDGITLLRQMNENGNMPLFIFISGYDRFEYAQNALKLGAIGYLLKPVDESELTEVLLKAKQQFLKTTRETQKTKEDQVKGIFKKEISDEKWEHFLRIHPSAALNKFVVISSEIDEPNVLKGKNIEHSELKLVLAEEWKVQAKRSGYDCVPVITELGIDLLLMPASKYCDFNHHSIEGMCKRTAIKFMEHSRNTMSCGIGQTVFVASNIHNSLQESRRALEYRLIMGRGTIFHFGRIRTKSFPVELLNQALKKRIEDILAIGDRSSIGSILNTIRHEMEKNQASPQDVKLFIYSFIDLIVHFLAGKNVISSYPMEPHHLYEEICQSAGLESILSKLNSVLENAIFATAREDADYYSKMVESIKAYIHERYKEEISMDLMSQHFHFSPNYLSKIFKEKTGESILNYMLKFRILMAKELLMKTQFSIGEIAAMVGYADNAKYFTKVFKKLVGVTPVEFIGKKKIEN